MNPFEMVVLIVAIVVAGRVLVSRYGSGSASTSAGFSAQEQEQLRAEIQKLKDRVAVLERLATDPGASLEREIEKLRERP